MLLILDNVDNPKVLNFLLSDLHQVSLLITSRDELPEIANTTNTSHASQLQGLDPSEGTKLIEEHLKGIRGGIDRYSAAELAKKLDYYPLYMIQMTSHIKTSSISPAGFCEQMDSEHNDRELQDLPVHSMWYDSTSVAKAIESHVAKHCSIDPEARQVLIAISFFDPDAIPERLLLSRDRRVTCLSNKGRLRKALSNLSRSSFVHENPGGSTHEHSITLHRLVRDAALRSANDTALQQAFEVAVSLLRAAFPLHKMSRDPMMEDWMECEIFQPHVLSLHHHYIELRDEGRLTPSFDLVELVYSCAW